MRKEFRKDRSEGFRAFFSSVPTSNDAHLKLELYDDNEPKGEEDWAMTTQTTKFFVILMEDKNESDRHYRLFEAENASHAEDVALLEYPGSRNIKIFEQV